MRNVIPIFAALILMLGGGTLGAAAQVAGRWTAEKANAQLAAMSGQDRAADVQPQIGRFAGSGAGVEAFRDREPRHRATPLEDDQQAADGGCSLHQVNTDNA